MFTRDNLMYFVTLRRFLKESPNNLPMDIPGQKAMKNFTKIAPGEPKALANIHIEVKLHNVFTETNI